MRPDSGHGSQVKDQVGDEVDGYDEGTWGLHGYGKRMLTAVTVILPADFPQAGIITDDVRLSFAVSQVFCVPNPL